MKKIISFLTAFLFLSHAAYAGSADSGLVSELSKSIEELRKLSEPGQSKTLTIRKDPLKPLVDPQGNATRSSSTPGAMNLEGVLVSGEDKTIMIDGQFYTEGSVVGTHRIVQISSDGFLAQEEGQDPVFFPLHSKE